MYSRCLRREPPKTSTSLFCACRRATFTPLSRTFASTSHCSAAFGVRTIQQDLDARRPAFGQLGKDTSTPSSASLAGSDGARRPKFGSGSLELTDEEKRVRDALTMKEQAMQPRQIRPIPMGPGTSSRNGRPTPQAARAATEEAARTPRGRAMQQHVQVSERSSSGNIFRSVLAKQPNGNGPRPEQNEHSRSGVGQWGQLRRTNQQMQHGRITQDQNSHIQRAAQISEVENRFTAGRAQREKESRLVGYRPLAASRNSPSFAASREPFVDRRTADPMPSKQDSPAQTRHIESATTQTRRSQDDDLLSFEERQQRFAQEGGRPSARSAEKKLYREPPRLKGSDRDRARKEDRFAYDADVDDEKNRLEQQKLKEEKKRQKAQRNAEKAAEKAASGKPILLPEYISVANLAKALHVKYEALARQMEYLGFEDTAPDYILNGENAGLVAQEYGYEPMIDRGDADDLSARGPAEDPTILPQRPPVVTIMGHVDHGKTTLLDYLRKSSVAATEHGGITQHIGAFSVPMRSGKLITFLDTPGHAAFLSMRQRGANVTDIVILVVAADDSVKPQTIEAISHAKAANVPIIVAINKIDKEDANIEKVKLDLGRHGVDVEDFGGDTQVVPVSGKTGKGIPDLEETVTALSEILDMRAEIDGPAEGWVLEASIKSMGKVATILVRRGTMRPGDFIVAGQTWARIRCMRNEAGIEIDSAGPGTPVEIDGWDKQPLAGDEVLQAPSEDKAKSVVDLRLERAERELLAQDMEVINEKRKAESEKRAEEKRREVSKDASDAAAKAGFTGTVEEGAKDVFFIIKGDVSGSVEAIVDQLSALGTREVTPRILRSGVGQLTEFDVEHAATARGTLINFNTEVDENIRGLAERAKIRILDHNVIYRLVDDVRAKLSEYLPPLVTYRVLGEAEVAQVFEITVKGRQVKAVAGCRVRNGVISRAGQVRVMRDGVKIYEGTLTSLKNVKKDVTEMRKGSECGLAFEDWADFAVGDQVQTFETKTEKRYL